MRSKGRASDSVHDYYPALQSCGVTPREAEVARLVVAGYENPEIADELGISLSTAKANVERLLRRLQAPRRGVLIGEISLIVRRYREGVERARRDKA